jgi:hypothetical protein
MQMDKPMTWETATAGARMNTTTDAYTKKTSTHGNCGVMRSFRFCSRKSTSAPKRASPKNKYRSGTARR